MWKAKMDIIYEDTISAQIHCEKWKINIILEIVDCLNGRCENDFVLFYLVNHFIINVYFYCTISPKICLSTNK